MLGDLDYKLCETALMELFATHTYPPQISEIREKCAEYTVPHLKDQGEAWGEVQKAISQYGYYRQEEALESLTPIVREAVRRLGFREICLDENQDAVRAHFFKIYSTLIERKTNDAKLPPSILEAKNKYIAQLTTHENVAIEQQHREQMAEEPERATPEYIDMLMREHGFTYVEHKPCYCPRCNHVLNAGPNFQPKYCSECGQKIDFSEVKWEEEKILEHAGRRLANE